MEPSSYATFSYLMSLLPYRTNLSYSFSLKKFLCFNLRKKRFSEASRFKVGSSLSSSNLEVSEIIS